jgi:hypothetical protein
MFVAGGGSRDASPEEAGEPFAVAVEVGEAGVFEFLAHWVGCFADDLFEGRDGGEHG